MKKIVIGIITFIIILIIILSTTTNQNSKMVSFGGTEDDYFNSLTPSYTLDNNIDGYIVVGNSSSKDKNINNNGSRDGIIVKYNKEKKLEWIKNFGGSSDDYFRSITPSYNSSNEIDGYIIVGRSDSTNLEYKNNGLSDAIIIKCNLNGEIIWQKNYGTEKHDNFNKVIISKKNNYVDGYIVVGTITSNVTKTDAIIIKYDLNGEIIWEKLLEGKNDDNYISVLQNENDIIVVGYSSSTDLGFSYSGLTEAIIVKYDNYGNRMTIKTLGGNSSDEFREIIPAYNDEKDGYIIVGRSDSNNIGFDLKNNYDGIITKYDYDLNQVWINSFGGSSPDAFLSVTSSTTDSKKTDGYIAIGYSESTDGEWKNMGNYDGIIAKYNLNGEREYLKNIGGNASDSLTSIININKEYIISGYSSSSDLGIKTSNKYDGIILTN